MEERTVRLEERVDRLQSDMSEVKGDIRDIVAKMDARLSAHKIALGEQRIETRALIAALRSEMNDALAALAAKVR